MKQIKNYEDYTIASDGIVTSYKWGNKGKILKPQRATQSQKGYYQVRLFSKFTPKGKLHYLHRLVWETYVGEIPTDMEIDHIDSNTWNNNLWNLQLITGNDNLVKFHKGKNINGIYIREHRDEMIKDYIQLGSIHKVAEKWGCSINGAYRVIKNQVSTKINGKNDVKIWNENLTDEFQNLDLRNNKTRELLGLTPIIRRKKK